MAASIKINNRIIGPGHPVYIIAEMSANHGQNFDEAVRLINAAKEAGADAIKLQTYTADTLTIDCDNEYFRIRRGTIWDGRTLYDLYKEAYTPWDWQPKLKKIANDLELDLFSSPFDHTAIDFLEKMDVPAYKISSFELVELPLIQHVAKTGKPVIMSTGMATLGEIDEAVCAARKAGAKDIALLKCTSAYPALPEEMNLRTISHMARAFHVPVGLSDHTLGIAVPIAAVSLGASIVEKHLTLSRSIPGPDSTFSLEPEEFKAMAHSIRIVEKALGKVDYTVTEREENSRIFRRSLFITKNIKAGELFTEDNIQSIRPSNGLRPVWRELILGTRASSDVDRGTPVSWELLLRREINKNIK